jgi:hypothetical protein
MGKFTIKELVMLNGLSIFGINYLVICNDLYLLYNNKILVQYIHPLSIESAITDFLNTFNFYDMQQHSMQQAYEL